MAEMSNDPKAYERGIEEFNVIEKRSTEFCDQVVKEGADKILKDDTKKFNLSTALLGTSKALAGLASFLYDNETEFLQDVKKARECVVTDIIPALLDAKPCGVCPTCKDGDTEHCVKPVLRNDMVTTRFIAVLANTMIEYDLFNKVIYTHLVDGKEDSSEGSAPTDDSVEGSLKSESVNDVAFLGASTPQNLKGEE